MCRQFKNFAYGKSDFFPIELFFAYRGFAKLRQERDVYSKTMADNLKLRRSGILGVTLYFTFRSLH